MEINRNAVLLLGWNQQGDLGPITTYTSKTGKLVVFPRSPPLNPPTPEQTAMRQRFKLIAALWRMMTHEQKQKWRTAAEKHRLRMTGYGLFVALQCKPDPQFARYLGVS